MTDKGPSVAKSRVRSWCSPAGKRPFSTREAAEHHLAETGLTGQRFVYECICAPHFHVTKMAQKGSSS